MFSKAPKKENIEIKELELSVNFFEENGSFVAYCPSLDMSTAGDSVEDAKKNFQEMVTLFFDDLVENNTVDQVMSELGWKRQDSITPTNSISRPRWMPPKMSQQSVSVKIPAMA